MTYYKVIDGKLDITTSLIDLEDGWIKYIIGEEPIELEEYLSLQEAEVKTQKTMQDYRNYLSNTDWYYARKVETGEEIPEDVVAKRIEAREFIRSQEDV